jgi:GMP synthase-like glutamine amidotransferase
LATEKAVIGVCLGGQLLASALGAIVQKNTTVELGWTRVSATKGVPPFCFNLPEEFEVMQWHEETFNLPKGAIKLAENTACSHQAYQIGRHVLAFQFHPEITKDTVKLFVEHSLDQPILKSVDLSFLTQLENSESERFIEGNQILKSAIDYVLTAHLK